MANHSCELPTKSQCACCGQMTLEGHWSYEICEGCHWEDDPAQNAEPDCDGGANDISLNEAKIYWKVIGKPLPPNGTEDMEKLRKDITLGLIK